MGEMVSKTGLQLCVLLRRKRGSERLARDAVQQILSQSRSASERQSRVGYSIGRRILATIDRDIDQSYGA